MVIHLSSSNSINTSSTSTNLGVVSGPSFGGLPLDIPPRHPLWNSSRNFLCAVNCLCFFRIIRKRLDLHNYRYFANDELRSQPCGLRPETTGASGSNGIHSTSTSGGCRYSVPAGAGPSKGGERGEARKQRNGEAVTERTGVFVLAPSQSLRLQLLSHHKPAPFRSDNEPPLRHP